MNCQREVYAWLVECLGQATAGNTRLRTGRFIEEAVELAQAGGLTEQECIDMVRYVYSRPVGDVRQEIGGVRISLAALCTAFGVDEDVAIKQEMANCWKNIEKIRARNLTKPRFE